MTEVAFPYLGIFSLKIGTKVVMHFQAHIPLLVSYSLPNVEQERFVLLHIYLNKIIDLQKVDVRHAEGWPSPTLCMSDDRENKV